MGYVRRTLRKVMLATNKYIDPKVSVLIELGDQTAFNDLIWDEYIDKYRIKNILQNYFKEYYTIDLKGEDIIKTDLSKYQPDLFKCDIITNIGTTEHVELEEGQYNCWLNLHKWLNIGGIMIHELPEVGSWKDHCRYYTTTDFFKSFESYGYEVLELDIHPWRDIGNCVWCVIKKIEHVPFMDQDTFFSLMHIDSSVPYSGTIESNNPKKL
jgi:hypothetical protein